MANEQEAHIAQLEADNQRLRRLLDQRDAPGELRHRLRSTVAMLRMIIRRSAETKRDLDVYVGHVEDRLDALIRVQSAVDEHGSVDIYRLVTDELLHYGATEGPRLAISGPRIELQPRAGQAFGLALHELAINAIEHGPLGVGAGHIKIDWQVMTDVTPPVVTFAWHETGRQNAQSQSHSGFGTEVLTRLLKYELDAEVSLDLGADEVRCLVRFPATERIGRVAV